MNTFEILEKYILDEIESFKKLIDELKVKQVKAEKDLELLNQIQKLLIDNDINKIDTVKLKELVEDLGEHSLGSDIDRLDKDKQISQFLFNSEVPSIGIKKSELAFIEEFKDKLKKVYDRNSNNNINSDTILKCESDINRYKNYLSLFTKEGFAEKTINREELNEFFNFLANSKLDKKLVCDIVFYYAEHVAALNLKRQEKIEKKELSGKTNEIPHTDEIIKNTNNNRERIITKKKKEVPVIKEDVEKLSLEEQALLDEVKVLIEERRKIYSNSSKESIDNSAIELFDGLDKADRLGDGGLYFEQGIICWTNIIADYDVNLLPNINKDKAKVFDIFKIIIEISKNKEYAAAETAKREYDIETAKFNELYGSIRELCDYYYKNFNGLQVVLSSKEIIDINNIAIEMDRIATETKVRIDAKGIDITDIKNCNDELLKLIGKYNEIFVKVQTIDNNTPVEDPSINSKYDLTKARTIVLLLKDKDDNVIPTRDIYNDPSPDRQAIKEAELKRAISTISNKGMANNRNQFNPYEVYYVDSHGKKRPLEEKYGFRVDRIRFTNYGRTSYVTIPVCEENRQKLISNYGENIFAGYNSMILIISSTFSANDKSEYNIVDDIVSENLNYIRNIITLFQNPNANEEDLVNIIEDSANECKKLTTNFGMGGK